MAARRTIAVRFPASAGGRPTARIRDPGEDLVRSVERPGLGDLGGFEAVDRAGDILVVRARRTKGIGTVRALLEAGLRRHLLIDHARIERT